MKREKKVNIQQKKYEKNGNEMQPFQKVVS